MACLPILPLSVAISHNFRKTFSGWPDLEALETFFDLDIFFCFSIDNPSQPETSLLGSPGISAPPDSDLDPRALLLARQREYKVAALNAKRAGDLDRARELMRVGKVWHRVRRPCVQPLISQL